MSAPTFDDQTGLHRINFFSDAVMAIAITLLLLDLSVRSIVVSRLVSYLVSFVVIGIYWEAHLRMFRLIRRYDRGLIWLNLLYLFFVALLPFPSRLIGAHPLDRLSIAAYASSVALLGLAASLLQLHAYGGSRLIETVMPAPEIRRRILYTALSPAFFALSIGLAFVSPYAAFACWFLALLVPIFARGLLKIT